jgi:glycosyltransferase involved in cell wall biosynthesis
VTAACVAVRRADFEAAGGFDEAFVLCGSDVALGLSLRQIGRRNLCVPSNALRHVESATRGTDIPAGDYFASWWRYQRWVRSGDPFFHPLLSLQSGAPHLRRRGEPSALEMIAPYLGRPLTVWRSGDDLEQAGALAQLCRLDPGETEAVRALHRANAAPSAPRTINWFIPGIDSPFYGGINTALRIAAKLAAEERVKNRFVVSGVGPAEFIRSGIAAAFPALADAPIWISDSEHPPSGAPEADADIATLWTTAYQVAAHAGAARKFYLVQDFEPMFYPAGSIYALAEESYRLGLYGICNTENLARIYREAYGGRAMHFTPAVDTGVFHAHGRVDRGPDAPVTLFVYARPGHWRNCWELAEAALDELKDRLGDRIRIIAAGSWAASVPGGRLPSISHLGLLDYAETGTLYRSCDMGLALTVSEHPSYLPLELMACGAGVVAFDNPAGHWLLKDSVNCLLAPRTVDGLADRLEFMAVSPILRRRLAEHALKDIAAHHSDWDAALSGIYPYLSDPEGAAPPAATPGASGGTHRLGNRGGARRGR